LQLEVMTVVLPSVVGAKTYTSAELRIPHPLIAIHPDNVVPVGLLLLLLCTLPTGVVGAKAYNLAKLRSTLPADVRVPSSVAVPFGVFERVLGHAANAGPAAQLAKLQAELGNARVSMCVWGGNVWVN
jgi:hypothetical protein